MNKITQEELNELHGIRKRYQDIMLAIGRIEIEKSDLLVKRKALNDQLDFLKKIESDYTQKITDKYGNISMNPETGEFE